MIATSKILLLVTLVCQYVKGFAPASMLRHQTAVRMSDDVSIPYDSAAMLAYDEWRAQYKKGDFDPVRYEAFKSNYETITVLNVKGKKEAREAGTEAPAPLTLNEYGDYTMAEYEAMAQAPPAPEPEEKSSGILGKAVDAAQQQSAASEALAQAADALSEEEEVSAFQTL